MVEFDEESLEELRRASYYTDKNPGMVARLNEAVQWCDAHGQVHWAVRLRARLISHAGEGGQSPQALVALSWLLSAVDRDPSLEALLIDGKTNLLMWYQKWVALAVAENPAVSRTQVEALLADMARRYDARGLSQSTVEYIAMRAMCLFGDLPAARQYYERWKALAADRAGDCQACVIHAVTQLHLLEEDLNRALAHAQPLLQGQLSCRDVPACTYADLLLPLLRANRLAEADRYQRRGQRDVVRLEGLVQGIGQHLQFLALTGQHDRARRLLTQTFVRGNACPEVLPRWYYLLGAWTLMERLAVAGQTAIQITLVEPLPLERQRHRYQVAAVRDWCSGQLEEIAGQFDRRNGNEFIRRLLDESVELAAHSYPLPSG